MRRSIRVSDNLKLAFYMIFLYGSMVIALDFMVQYYRSFGYGNYEIGLVMTAGAIANTIAQPLWGLLCDKFQKTRVFLIIGLVLAAAALFSMRFVAGSLPLLMISVIVFVSGALPMMSLSDGWVSRLIFDGRDINYGLVRSMGSLAYASVALLMGNLITLMGAGILPFVFAALVGMLILVSFSIVQPEKVDRKAAGGEEQIGFFDGLKMLIKNKDYMFLCIAVYLAHSGASGIHNFLSLRMGEIGGTMADVGLAVFFLGLSEIPVVILFRKFSHLLPTNKFIMISFFCTTLKLGCIALSTTPTGIMLSMLLQSISYGLYLVSVVTYLREIVDRRILLTAQTTLGSAAVGLSQMTGSFFGGLLSERYGLSFMYMIAVCTALLGACIFAGYLLFSKQLFTKKRI